ncbi:17351_t:CDS:2 [Entrophospora sp. SA101]|nr:17346_t:CDS:2 [Entrophospora sp. SA101]CAJ0920380.1 17351_t:CDS:2 [Entrophospora sp. SA101]
MYLIQADPFFELGNCSRLRLTILRVGLQTLSWDSLRFRSSFRKRASYVSPEILTDKPY